MLTIFFITFKKLKRLFIQLKKTFTDPKEALGYINKFPADLIFLAIQMPLMSGIKFSKNLQKETMIIFTTAYSKYAMEGFNLGAVDYLLKPFSFERFLKAAKKAEENFKFLHQKEQPDEQHLFIRADYSLVKITIKDILYLEALDDYLKIHISNQKIVVSKMTMKAVLEKLPAKEFIRVHRSFIIPLSRITSIRKRIISIADVEIPIGASYEKKLFEVFKK